MRRFHLSLILAALAAAACTDSAGPDLRQPAKLEIVYGQGQTGTVGSRLETLVAVRVVDAVGRPVAGQPVSFVVAAGGGAVSPATDVTDRHGVAQSWWTMGTVAGTAQAVEAHVAAGATALSTTFTAHGTPGAAARLVRYPVPDDSGFVSVIGALLEDSLAVKVFDAFGNPVPGVEVAWTAGEGSGTMASPTTTDSLGVARTTWQLGSAADQLAYASLAGVGPVRFVAQAATRLAWVCNGCQTVEAGSRVHFGVQVYYGSALGPPATVAFEVAPGSGTVTPTVSTSVSGVAWVDWTLGDSPGPQKLIGRLGRLQVDFVTDALPRLVPVAEVPGTVLDATSDRVLWRDDGGVKIRTIATSADEMVPRGVSGHGVLFDGGALLWDPDPVFGSPIYEYRNGAVAHLGWYDPKSPPSVDGNWAAWGAREGALPGVGSTFIVRRDLAAGTTLFLPEPSAFPGIVTKMTGRSPDVGPHGEVVFVQGYPDLVNLGKTTVWLYRNGSYGRLSDYNARDAQTDGFNVAITVLSPGFHNIPYRTRLCLSNMSGVDCLTSVDLMNAVIGYEIAGGWITYYAGGAVVRRSPAGVTEQMSFCVSIQALAPDGTLVCGNGDRYRLIRPDGTAYDAGRSDGRLVWRGDRFLVIRGGGVYTFGDPPAAQLR